MSKALRFKSFGDPTEVLAVEDIPFHQNAGEATVKVLAAGINPSDIKNVQGRMHHSSVPRVPGRDFVGVVVEGPKEWLNRKVWGTGGDIGFTRDGSHSQLLSVPVAALIEMPSALDIDIAATSALTYVTAYLCFLAGVTAATKTALVIGAAGGVGNAALQICRQKGLKTIGLVRKRSDAQKLQEYGFDALATDDSEAKDGLADYGLPGVDLVVDTVGGKMFNMAFSVLNQGGRITEIAAPASDQTVTFNLADFYHREATLTGVDSRSYGVVACADMLRALSPIFSSGVNRSQEIEKLALSDAINAYQAIASGSSRKRYSIHPND